MQTLLTGDYKITALQKEIEEENQPVLKKKLKNSGREERKSKRPKGCPKPTSSVEDSPSGGSNKDDEDFFANFCKVEDPNKEDNLADLTPQRLLELVSERTAFVEPLWPEQQLMLMKIADEFNKREEPSEEDLERYQYYISVLSVL